MNPREVSNMQTYNPNQYYNDYIPATTKTSQQLVTVNWSGLGDILVGIAVIFMLILTAGIC